MSFDAHAHPDRSSQSQAPGWAGPFFTIWTGQAFSLLGSSLVQFALVWWLTEETGSATVLATATLFALLPQVFLGPFAGALVDRWCRRWVMVVADSLVALATALLVGLFVAGVVQPWHIYIIMLVRSAGSAFHWPAMQASTTLMVPQKQLSRVSGMNQALGGAMTIMAPPLGALLLMVLPVEGVVLIDVITALPGIVPLLFIDVPQPERAADGTESVFQDFVIGLRYVWAWPGLRTLLILAMLITLSFYPTAALMPLAVTDHFGGGASDLAWMQSVRGIGLVLGGIVLGVWGGFERRIVTSLLGLIGMGLGLLLTGLLPSSAFGLALGFTFVAGFMMSLHGGPLYAAIQASVAPEMQGRALSLVNSLSIAMTPLSLAVAGPVADVSGVMVWYVLGGAACVLLGVAGLCMPVLVAMEEQVATPPEVAAAPTDI
ncbi:MAG: MFS transporter [Anaerolineae bacterium]|nr:MFS transporter [Anaerolineae bacterium]